MLDEPDIVSSRTARQRIGGRWALSWQTYLITGGLGIFALLAGEAQSSVGHFPGLSWLVLGIAGMLAVGLVLAVLDYTFFRNRRENPLPIWAVVLADGILGLVFTLVTGLGAALLELPTSSGLLERCVLNAMYAMWWGPTLSYFMDLREQWVKEREQLVNEFVRVELTAIQQGELMSLMQAELDAEIADELGPARERINDLRHEAITTSSSAARSSAEWHEAAQVLRGAAEDSVRPLSRQLLKETEKTYPRTHWWTLLANIVRKQPFQPLAFAVIDILGTFSPLIRTYGVTRGLALLFGGLAWTVLLMLVGNALMRRYPRQHSILFLGTLMALQSTVLLRGAFREMWVPGSASSSWVITQIFAGVAVVFVTSGFGAWWSQRVEIRATLREEIRTDRIQAMALSRQVALIARETSQVLHGSVQTRLVSCAMAIEQANASGDDALLNEALNEAIGVLDRPISESTNARSLADEIARKVDLWDGLCEFTLTLDSSARDVSSASAVTIGRIIEEGISNGIRHGKAKCIDIRVARTDYSTVHILIVDDGLGPQDGEPSLGSAYVGHASANRWSLTAANPGSRLEVYVSA